MTMDGMGASGVSFLFPSWSRGFSIILSNAQFWKRKRPRVTGRHSEKLVALPAIEHGGFLKWWYPQIIHLNRVFHYFHHPFWGAPIFGNTHILLMVQKSGKLTS